MKRDVASRQFHFELQAVVRGPEQDRLLLQGDTCFPVSQDLRNHIIGLFSLILTRDQLRRISGLAVRPQFLSVPLFRQSNDLICGSENGLRTTVVLFQRQDGCTRELLWKIEDVTDRCRAKRID